MSLGSTIKSLAKSKKISLRKLATLAGVSKTTVNDIANDISANPTRETISKIANALGVPVGLLLGEESAIQDITNDLTNMAEFGGPLKNLPYEEKQELMKELLFQEPQVFYQTAAANGYLGPLTEDELIALRAYLKIYRETKEAKKHGETQEKN